MKQYLYVEINFNGKVFKLFINGEKYATTDTTEMLSYCINEAIKDYLEETEMTLEELKAEADKLGYRLVEKQPYIPFPSCKCTNYRKGLRRYEDNDGYYYECDICGCSSESAKTVREAQLNWYNFTVERYGRKEL